jgi:hypothetical protein
VRSCRPPIACQKAKRRCSVLGFCPGNQFLLEKFEEAIRIAACRERDDTAIMFEVLLGYSGSVPACTECSRPIALGLSPGCPEERQMPDFQPIFERHHPQPGYCLVLRPFNESADRTWGAIKEKLERTFR